MGEGRALRARAERVLIKVDEAGRRGVLGERRYFRRFRGLFLRTVRQ